MVDFLLGVLWATWEILKDASVFLLFGFLLAGVLAVLVPRGLLTRLVGTGKVKSVLWGSVLGLPLPLCSCGVLPTALGLRRQGATPGATVAFLVATPETGADSISLTYALTDPIITVFRPIAGIVTAIAAGLATNLIGAPRPRATTVPLASAAQEAPEDRDIGPSHCDDEHCEPHHHDADGSDHAHRHDNVAGAKPADFAGRPLGGLAVDAAKRMIRYGFADLFDDVAWWLALGILLSAIAEVAIPAGPFEGTWGSGLASMLTMLALSVPLYTCAASSTPMAAALGVKGLSPGGDPDFPARWPGDQHR